MGVKLGSLDISAMKVGSADCTVYLGDTLLYPSGFNGKWKATYSDSSVTTADCDASSAITQNEIALSNLVEVEIGDCVTSIGYKAFYYCRSLTSCTIGSSVTSIGEQAFMRCSGLTYVTIGNGVTSIGESAFEKCTSITSIDIPSGVTEIGNYAFQDCSLTAIDIPDSVTSIGSSVLYGCTSLSNCTIGSGVTSIGTWAFRYCTSLTSITCLAITPPTLGTIPFDDTNNCPIYVPSASLAAYQSASGWSTYASRISAITNS